MATNPRYVTTKTLEPYFVDKTTGDALVAGTVEFYKDDDRLVPKAVYQLSGAPPNYTFTALPNPLTLSGVGTIQNAGGDNVALYYLPYVDENSDVVELYYVVVKDSDGVVQFTREGWPDIDAGSTPGDVSDGTIINEISNSQFVDVYFTGTLTVPYTGNTTTTMPIAPDWDLVIAHSDMGSIMVTRNAIAGNSHTATNPPYTLTITCGANVTSLKLRQRFAGNPDIWVPSAVGVNGYINGGVLLGANTSVVMRYEPSTGTDQEILNDANATGATAYFNATVQLAIGDNPEVGGVGYVDITLQLSNSNGAVSVISSVQIVGLVNNQNTAAYKQDSINRQEDYLFHYYNSLLQYKPIPSYLEGWDFPLNPAQFLGKTVAASNTAPGFSKYVWDQTILFQSQQTGIGITQSSTGAIVLTNAAVTATRAALIQYQEGLRAREILNSRLSAMVRAFASANVTATISLWYTTDASLPDVSTGVGNSIVLTLDANGKPATFNGAWSEVPHLPVDGGTASTQDATFTIGTSATTNFNEYGFSGWDLNGVAGVGTATFFAIVVGTGDIAAAGTVSIESISLVPGDIATRPAPQSLAAVTADCESYYTKSFAVDTVPATTIALDDAVYFPSTRAGVVGIICQKVIFATSMRAIPVMTYFNPINNNALAHNLSTGVDMGTTTDQQVGEGGFTIAALGDAGMAAGNLIIFNWTADARLGIV